MGKAVLRHLSAKHDVVPVDRRLDGIPGIEGDLTDPAVLERLFIDGCDAVVHLATIPGGAAEADPSHAKRVNVDATMDLIDYAARAGHSPRFIFASSIAVFGDPLPPLVDDDTPPSPRLIYGAHKAMMEQWIETQTRRGAISGLSLRLPGIVARPRGPSGMKSAFMSDVFHAFANRETLSLPVSPTATMWLMSVAAVVRNLVVALEGDATGSLTLPAIRTTASDLVQSLGNATGGTSYMVTYEPDPMIEAGFGSQPPLAAPRAQSLGFRADDGLDALVQSALAQLSSGNAS